MYEKLDTLSISGFKSIKELKDFKLGNVNILIGANGAGKSNFLEIFTLLSSIINTNLAQYTLFRGGCDPLLFCGPKITNKISASFTFGLNKYRFGLVPTSDERFLINSEELKYNKSSWRVISQGNHETSVHDLRNKSSTDASLGTAYDTLSSISSWMKYHFHDTGSLASMRRSEIIDDSAYLRHDAANIAPFLLRLRNNYPKNYVEIIQTIRLVAPFFDDFILEPQIMGGNEKVKLSWKQKNSDYPMQPSHFSDGTIRFICLAAALLQPVPPPVVVIDEPELGLHPYAIEIISEVIRSVSEKTQIVISTQSTVLVDCFDVEDIVIVGRERSASTFSHLDSSELSEWLEDYSLGELWRKNLLAGSPSYES